MRYIWILALAACASHEVVNRDGFSLHVFTRDNTNTYLIAQKQNLLLIDSGYEKSAERLDHDIRAAGFDPAAIHAIILTHAHHDHAGGAHYFHEHFGTKIIAGAGDEDMLTSGHNQPMCPQGLLGKWRLSTDQNATYTPQPPDLLLKDKTLLSDSTGVDATAYLLPGHTRGSLVVVMGDLVFVGDLFRGAIVGSSAEAHFYHCDPAANRRDIQRVLKELAPNATTFYTGHFGPVSRQAVIDAFDH